MSSRLRYVLGHPMARGMIAYSVLWPTGSLVQQTLSGKNFGMFEEQTSHFGINCCAMSESSQIMYLLYFETPNCMSVAKQYVQTTSVQYQSLTFTFTFTHTATYDWAKCARFSAYGSLFVAPTLFAWVRFAGVVWPAVTLGTAISKATVEQLTYGPAATCCFFFAMTYMDTLDAGKARREVADKFLATYKVRAERKPN